MNPAANQTGKAVNYPIQEYLNRARLLYFDFVFCVSLSFQKCRVALALRVRFQIVSVNSKSGNGKNRNGRRTAGDWRPDPPFLISRDCGLRGRFDSIDFEPMKVIGMYDYFGIRCVKANFEY